MSSYLVDDSLSVFSQMQQLPWHNSIAWVVVGATLLLLYGAYLAYRLFYFASNLSTALSNRQPLSAGVLAVGHVGHLAAFAGLLWTWLACVWGWTRAASLERLAQALYRFEGAIRPWDVTPIQWLNEKLAGLELLTAYAWLQWLSLAVISGVLLSGALALVRVKSAKRAAQALEKLSVSTSPKQTPKSKFINYRS